MEIQKMLIAFQYNRHGELLEMTSPDPYVGLNLKLFVVTYKFVAMATILKFLNNTSS